MPKPYTSPTPETQVEADPVLERRTRRTFSTDYKLRVIAQADRCAHGELGALLRQEKLYSAQLQQWRREFADAGVNGVSKTTPGPKAKRSAEQREIDALRRRNAQLNRQLEIANGCLNLQKKPWPCAIKRTLGTMYEPSDHGKAASVDAGLGLSCVGPQSPHRLCPPATAQPHQSRPSASAAAAGADAGRTSSGVDTFRDQQPPKPPSGFRVLPRRWVVERTFAWLGRNRRFAKDYEQLIENSDALVYMASTRIVLNRLAQ